jgi:hypothetical protein
VLISIGVIRRPGDDKIPLRSDCSRQWVFAVTSFRISYYGYSVAKRGSRTVKELAEYRLSFDSVHKGMLAIYQSVPYDHKIAASQGRETRTTVITEGATLCANNDETVTFERSV